MPDQLEELFAELRADTLPRVQPPGVRAAAETVRRRRTTRKIAVATALLTVAGGGTAIGLAHGGGDRREQSAGQRSPVVAARQAVSLLGDRKAEGLVGDALPAAFTDLSAGSYQLAVACGGRGVLTVHLVLRRDNSEPQDLGGQVLSCASDPHPASMLFRMSEQGTLSVSIVGDAQAGDGAAYALALADNEDAGTATEASQQSVWNADRAFELLAGSSSPEAPQSITTEDGSQLLMTSADAGEYLLRLACAGPGTVSVKLEQLMTRDGKPDNVGETLAEETIDCIDVDPHSDNGLSTVWMPADSGYVVTVNPDEEARNRAGVAWVLVPQ